VNKGGSSAWRDELLGALEEVGGNRAHTVAVLWTWLARHPQLLTALHDKAPAIRDAAAAMDRRGEVIDDTLGWIEQSPLVKNAVVLLALIEIQLSREMVRETRRASMLMLSKGVDRTPVIVHWRNPSLAIAAHTPHRPTPPGTATQPSLSAFAPRLRVCPVEKHEVKLQVLSTKGPEWEAALRLLDLGLSSHPASLQVHLDTLGDHGMSGWRPTGYRVGCYHPGEINAEDERLCIDAAEKAVRKAAAADSQSTVLLMPELAATPRVRAAITAQIASQPNAAALTVIGLYHEPHNGEPPIDHELLEDSSLGAYVNEAVVLGPNGNELWRHCKLSAAKARFPGSKSAVSEDIVPGVTLSLAPTPIGVVAVAICLDAFAESTERRLEASPAEVLLIPSLSPTVIRHRYSLQRLVQVLWAIGFVCNRAPFPPSEGGSVWNEEDNRSFWAMQREPLHIPPKSDPDAHPSFIFALADRSGSTA
jgi:hypothetical protein